MTTFSRVAFSVLISGLLSVSAMAVPINFGGDVTFDVAPGSTLDVGGGIATGSANNFTFGAPWASISEANCPPCGFGISRSLSGTFSAASGRIITSIYTTVTYGPSSTIFNTYGLSDMTWTITGGTYTGSPADQGGFSSGYYNGNWKVNGPNTGEAHSINGFHSGPFVGANSNNIGGQPIAPYSINATSFALDLSHYTQMGLQFGSGYFGPLGFSVFVQTADAPPPPTNGAPAPTTLAVLGLGLLGFGATRRRMK